jgi:hypothetical protein
MPVLDLLRVDQDLRAAGFHFDGLGVTTAAGPTTITHNDLQPGEFLRIDNPVEPLATFATWLQARSLFARKPRSVQAIIEDLLNNTTAQQKALIRADLTSGNPPKWRAGGPMVWSQAAAFTGATNQQQAIALAVAVAYYLQEFPTYLVHPSFAPTLNIPGDEPA